MNTWYDLEREKSTEIIDNIVSIIQINKDTNIKSKIHKVTGTYISIYSNICGQFKTYRYFLLYPFDEKKKHLYDYEYEKPITPYKNVNPHLFMKDFYFYADNLFHKWMFDTMAIGRKKPIFAVLDENNIGWKIQPDDHPILLISSFKHDFDKYENFEEWYKTEECNISFDLEITNPFLYAVPFPVRRYIYEYNKTGKNSLQLK